MAATDYTQVVREALAGYLKAQLLAAYPTMVVYPEWPENDKLAEYSVYIANSADGEFEWYPPVPISIVPDASPAKTGTVTFAYGRCNNLPLEIDVWASAQLKRDNFSRDLGKALFTPPSVTIAGQSTGDLTTEADLIIPIPGMFNQPGRYSFNPTGVPEERSDDAERNEWRSHWRGFAEFSLVAQQAGVALRKRLRLLIGAGELPLHTNPREERDADTSTTIRIVTSPVALARPGAQALRIVATFAGGMIADVTKLCSFTSDAPTTANVDASGLVLAGLNAGTAHITVTYGAASAVVTVTVS